MLGEETPAPVEEVVEEVVETVEPKADEEVKAD